MVNFINHILDLIDAKISLVILLEDEMQLQVLRNAISVCGAKRFRYTSYRDALTPYAMELRMPYNRFVALNNRLHITGWNIAMGSDVNILCRLVKF